MEPFGHPRSRDNAEPAWLVAIGIGIGTIAALMLTRVLASQLYGITVTIRSPLRPGSAFSGW